MPLLLKKYKCIYVIKLFLFIFSQHVILGIKFFMNSIKTLIKIYTIASLKKIFLFNRILYNSPSKVLYYSKWIIFHPFYLCMIIFICIFKYFYIPTLQCKIYLYILVKG